MERGIVKYTGVNRNGNPIGYIIPDNKIPNYDRDVVFFENNLKDISFDSLEINTKVEFILKRWNNKYIACDIVKKINIFIYSNFSKKDPLINILSCF